jgi:hypothetical protein
MQQPMHKPLALPSKPSKAPPRAVIQTDLSAVIRPMLLCYTLPSLACMPRRQQPQTLASALPVSFNSHIPDDVLRMELGCRSYASWMDQRKLEYAFRLGRMSDDRLPRHVQARTDVG